MSDDRFEELWTAYLEGELDAAGFDELQQLLAGDPELLRRAADLYGEHRLLGLVHQSDDRFVRETMDRALRDREGFVAAVVRHAAPRPSKGRRVVGYVAVAAAAFLLSIGVQRILSRPPASPPEPVATLLRADGARWEREGILPEGRRLLQGRLHLVEGKAAILFDSGAVMVLSGDADLDLESRGRALLRSGKVTVEASEAFGFTVRTPKGEVVDLGTEFAVAVESGGATEVHVLQGEVAWERPSEKTRHLQTGQAVRFDSTREGRVVPLTGQGFKELMGSIRPEPREQAVIVAEGFDYPAGPIEPAQAAGGVGFKGPWRVRTPEEAGRDPDPSTAMTIVSDGLLGRSLQFPAARTFRIRPLAEPIDLGRDDVTYVSFLMRQEVGFGMPPQRRPAIYRNRDNFNSSVAFETGPVLFWVCKIAARRDGPDEVFLKIFRPGETVGALEPATWTNQTAPFRSDARLDLLVVTGTGAGRQWFDELRIGRTWQSVTK
jgi:predicted RecA/RadA family phage recombinase